MSAKSGKRREGNRALFAEMVFFWGLFPFLAAALRPLLGSERSKQNNCKMRKARMSDTLFLFQNATRRRKHDGENPKARRARGSRGRTREQTKRGEHGNRGVPEVKRKKKRIHSRFPSCQKNNRLRTRWVFLGFVCFFGGFAPLFSWLGDDERTQPRIRIRLFKFFVFFRLFFLLG